MDLREWQKRLTFLILICSLVFVSFIGRLYQKSVIEHDATVQAAENQYTLRREVIGHRGDIVIHDTGDDVYPLATNERRYQVLVVPKNVKDYRKVAEQLAPIIRLSEPEIFDKINNQKLYIPPLVHRLSREDADRIAALKLRGVVLLPEFTRIYPERNLASHLLGFVNNDGKGNYGVEGTYDFNLKGAVGYQVAQKDSTGRLINAGDSVKPKNGATITLTIDREIQFFVEKTLVEAVKNFEADGGTIIIVNPRTGALIAMASAPNFDPNSFNKVPTDQQSVFLNPAVAEVWEPGSIIKPIIMALAVDHGLVEPDTKETFGAFVQVLNHTIYTAEKKAFGTETMTQVLENSDNVGMVWVSGKLGNQTLHDGLIHFGFGTQPDFKLQGIISGYLLPLKQWNDLTRATIAFGQGISSTPLQMVMAYAAIANKGVLMAPYVVETVQDDGQVISQTKPHEVGRAISEQTSNKISLMVESVVVNGHGKRAGVPGYRIGGKTGTAQVANPQGGYYDDRHIGSFAGYFPISDPRYAMLVKLNNPKNVRFAESSAAPTFGTIAAWILQHQQIKPDKS